MSNDLAMLDVGLPAHLKAYELDDTTKALMGGGSGGSKRISIEGGVWRLWVRSKKRLPVQNLRFLSVGIPISC